MKIASAGAAFGIAAAIVTVGITMRVIPELAGESTWAFGFGVPIGLLAGALMAGFLSERGRHVQTFSRLIVETMVVTAITAIAVSQFVIPVAWHLPRAGVTTVVAIGAAGFAALGAWLLKPLYWRRSS